MISTILIFIVAFLSLIALMIIHEFGHFIIAKKFGVRVEEFGIGYPPRVFGKKIGDTIYSINLLPLGAFVRIYGEEGGVDDLKSFANLKIWKRVLIIIGGVAAFWLASIVIFSIVFAMGADLPVSDADVPGLTNPQIKVISVSHDSPAGQAGILAGDTIKDVITDTEINSRVGIDVKINKISDFQNVTNDNKGKMVTVVIERSGKIFNFNLTPRVNPPAGQGAVGIGLERMATLVQKSSWYMAPIQGANYTWQTTVGAIKGLYAVFSGLIAGRGAPQGAEFAGPLGITVFLANAATYGIGFFLYFIGSLSVFIAIFNLFPIPALDGGKLVFLLIEKIKGKPVSAKVEQGITVVFFVILICLSLFITVRFDIPRVWDFFKASLQK